MIIRILDAGHKYVENDPVLTSSNLVLTEGHMNLVEGAYRIQFNQIENSKVGDCGGNAELKTVASEVAQGRSKFLLEFSEQEIEIMFDRFKQFLKRRREHIRMN